MPKPFPNNKLLLISFPTNSQTRSLCAIDPPTDEACQGTILVHLLFEFLLKEKVFVLIMQQIKSKI